MRKSKHCEAQSIEALKQVEAGRSVEDVARDQGLSMHTTYAWKLDLIFANPDGLPVEARLDFLGGVAAVPQAQAAEGHEPALAAPHAHVASAGKWRSTCRSVCAPWSRVN